MKIIRTNSISKEYQYSKYRIGDVLEVINEYDDHYVAKILSGSEPGSIMAVCKNDCEQVHLGSYSNEETTHIKI